MAIRKSGTKDRHRLSRERLLMVAAGEGETPAIRPGLFVPSCTGSWG